MHPLLVVLIILGVRLIQILDRAEKVIDNVEEKVNSLNGLFYVIDKTTSSIDLISTKVVSSIVNLISKIFGKDNEEKAYLSLAKILLDRNEIQNAEYFSKKLLKNFV